MTKIDVSFLSVRNGRTDAGIAPGSFQAINPSRTVIGPDGPAGPPVSVSLDAVIFADGELVGPDRTDTFAFVTAKLRAERDLHTQFLASEHGSSAGQSIAWNTIVAAANGQITVPDGITKKAVYLPETRTKAKELLNMRAKQNDAAAFALAHRSEIYPTIWRQQ